MYAPKLVMFEISSIHLNDIQYKGSDVLMLRRLRDWRGGVGMHLREGSPPSVSPILDLGYIHYFIPTRPRINIDGLNGPDATKKYDDTQHGEEMNGR
jgi:hypothetical protein